MRERAAVWLVVLVVVTSAAGIGAMPFSQSATGPDNAEIEDDGAGAIGVQNIQLVDQQRGVLRYAVEYSGSLDRSYLERSLVRAVDHDRIDASSIRVTEVESHVATVEVSTNGSENPQTVASRMLRAMQLTTSQTQSHATSMTDDGPSANASTGGNGKAKDTGQAEAYYQIDFVQGEPIENLQGSVGTYQPDELIRYAHGSTENLLKRSSNGEFTTNESLAECVESSAIVVKSDGTARVSFKIADGCDPVTLSLVSYTKPGPVWSRATESEQEFVDADTRTFEPGGTYTLRVELPPTEDSTTTAATSSESSATERPETDTATETEEGITDSEPDRTSTPAPDTAASEETTRSSTPTETSTPTPTATTTVEVQPQPTPTLTPTPTPETSTTSAATSPDTETPGSSTSEGSASSQGSSRQTEATDDPPTPSTTEPPTTTESDNSDGGSTPTDTPTDDSGNDSASSSTPTESPTTTDDSDDGDDSTPTATEPPETSTTEPTTTEPPETTETSTETTAEPTTEPPTTTEEPATTTTTTETTATTTTEAPETTTTQETTTREPTETSTETTVEPTTESPTTTEIPETTETITETTAEPTTEPPTTTESPETTTTTTTTTTSETTTTTTSEPTTTGTPEPTTTTQPTTTTEGPPEGGNSAEVRFNDQSLEEALRVVAESVTLPPDSNGGFLVAYDAANFGEVDRPDDRIGVSEKLASGTTESVQVALQFGNASVNERVTVVVVRDSNGNGQYDPGVDTGALNEKGEIASDSAEVSIAVGLLPDPPDNGDDEDGGSNTTTTTTTTTSNESDGGNESDDGGGILGSDTADAAEAESTGQNASATDTTTTTDPAKSTDEEASTPENEGMKATVTKTPT